MSVLYPPGSHHPRFAGGPLHSFSPSSTVYNKLTLNICFVNIFFGAYHKLLIGILKAPHNAVFVPSRQQIKYPTQIF